MIPSHLADAASMAAEWSPHRTVWLAWPSQPAEWDGRLEPVQTEFVGLCRAIADRGPDGRPRGEALHVLALASTADEARNSLEGLGATVHVAPYGDIWLRDTGPIFRRGPAGLQALRFRFNGWGGKYLLDGDDGVAEVVAQATDRPRIDIDFVLEGGAVEFDGEGTVLTTRSCLLNPNRNPGVAEAEAEDLLRSAFGVSRVVWLDEGMPNDHTDGHIDTLARFVAPGRVVCMTPSAGDPNADIFLRVADQLRAATDARGRRLDVVTVPSPGLVLDDDGEAMPASFVNFYIANTAVVVPTYGTPYDDEAVSRIAALFPNRRTVGTSARYILTGGGAFHCMTQQEPLGESDAS